MLTTISPLSLLAAIIFWSGPLTALDVRYSLRGELFREPYVASIVAFGNLRMGSRPRTGSPSAPEHHHRFRKSFLWVTPNISNTGQEVRAHAARQSYRQQRWRDLNVRRSRVGVSFPWAKNPLFSNTSSTQGYPSETRTQNPIHHEVAKDLSTELPLVSNSDTSIRPASMTNEAAVFV
jgi:hypothetical protein